MERSNKKGKITIIVIVAIVVVATVGFMINKLNENNLMIKADHMTVEYGKSISIDAREYLDLSDVKNQEEYLKKIKITKDSKLVKGKKYEEIGDHEVKISNGQEEKIVKVIVKDTTKPKFNNTDKIDTFIGEKINYQKFIKATDLDKVTLNFDEKNVDISKAGEYILKVSAVDSSANKASKDIKVTVKKKPVIPKGSKVEVKKDKKGNVVSKVVPKEKPKSTVNKDNRGDFTSSSSTGDKQLDAMCDDILAGIISPSMSQRSKASAIYNWVTGHIRYGGSTSKSNWTASAKNILRSRRGNCVAFCYSSKALLTRAGLSNVAVSGYKGAHMWNMVKVNGSWFHFDTTPGWGKSRFLWTTKQMKNYRYKNLRYTWDAGNYPTTP